MGFENYFTFCWVWQEPRATGIFSEAALSSPHVASCSREGRQDKMRSYAICYRADPFSFFLSAFL